MFCGARPFGCTRIARPPRISFAFGQGSLSTFSHTGRKTFVYGGNVHRVYGGLLDDSGLPARHFYTSSYYFASSFFLPSPFVFPTRFLFSRFLAIFVTQVNASGERPGSIYLEFFVSCMDRNYREIPSFLYNLFALIRYERYEWFFIFL